MSESNITDLELWKLIRITHDVVYKSRQRELYSNGVPMINPGILYAIHSLGKEATPTKIAERTFKERHSISEQLSRMENEGLIRKIKDLKYKNYLRVELTGKGYEIYEKLREHKSLKLIMSALTNQEQRELWFLLTKIRDKAIQV